MDNKYLMLGIAIAVVLYFGNAFAQWGYPSPSNLGAVQPTGVSGPGTVVVSGCNLPSAPSVTVSTPDLFGGAAVTTQNAYRKVGTASWTDVAGAGTFSANPGDTYELVFGVDSNDDDDEPFGPKITYTVPCESYPTIEQAVVDDALDTDLVVRSFDPEDGNAISVSDLVDIDEGDVFNLKTEWQSSFEEDFGNRYCGKGNALVLSYNTSQFTDVYATDLSGSKYPGCSVPTLYSAVAGYSAKCFEVPTLKSNQLWTFYIVADASGSGKAPDGESSNVTAYLYDSDWFFNNDVSPSQAVCGWEDEDGGDIGSAGGDSLTIGVTDD